MTTSIHFSQLVKDMSLEQKEKLIDGVGRYLPKVEKAYVTMAGSLCGGSLTPIFKTILKNGDEIRVKLTDCVASCIAIAVLSAYEREKGYEIK